MASVHTGAYLLNNPSSHLFRAFKTNLANLNTTKCIISYFWSCVHQHKCQVISCLRDAVKLRLLGASTGLSWVRLYHEQLVRGLVEDIPAQQYNLAEKPHSLNFFALWAVFCTFMSYAKKSCQQSKVTGKSCGNLFLFLVFIIFDLHPLGTSCVVLTCDTGLSRK